MVSKGSVSFVRDVFGHDGPAFVLPPFSIREACEACEACEAGG